MKRTHTSYLIDEIVLEGGESIDREELEQHIARALGVGRSAEVPTGRLGTRGSDLGPAVAKHLDASSRGGEVKP